MLLPRQKNMPSILCAFVFCIFFFQAGSSWGSGVDDVFGCIIENAFQKTGKNLDNLDFLKKGDSFSDILKKSDADFWKAIGKKNIPDDAGDLLKKMDFPPGSKNYARYVDNLGLLSKQERQIGYLLDDVTFKVAKLPGGQDIVERVGKKGLLLGVRYGDDVVQKVDEIVEIARKDDFWSTSLHGAQDVTGQTRKALENFFQDQKIPGGYEALRGVSEVDPVDFSARVLQKYSVQGLESIGFFLKNV